MKWGLLLDEYERRARLTPALIVIFPIASMVAAWFPGGIVGWGGVWATITFAGGGLLLTHLARDLGKRIEPELFLIWGGNPAVQALRHAVAGAAASRRHAKLATLIDDVTLPSPTEEEKDPRRADEIYERCVSYLRTHTRDQKRFRLLFLENCSYGFWRNLLGLRIFGLATAIVAVIAMIGDILLRGLTSATPVALVVLLVNAMLALMWMWKVTPDTVRLVAGTYADRLMEALDLLS